MLNHTFWRLYRNTGLGIAGGCGYVGSIVAPYASYLVSMTSASPIWRIICLIRKMFLSSGQICVIIDHV